MILAFNKPYGVLSQFTPELAGQRTLAEFNFPKNVYPIGRLDRDSEGLLLLSDEKGINDALLHPKNAHERVYLAQVESIPSPKALEQLMDGSIIVKSHRCLPCIAELLQKEPDLAEREPPIRVRKNIPTSWIKLSLTEGKNRQVRRMTAAVGHPTLRLYRESIADYKLEDLDPGKWKILSASELYLLNLE